MINRFKILMAVISLAVPLAVPLSASADSLTVNSASTGCTSNNIQNFLLQGANDATGANGCGTGSGSIQAEIRVIASEVVNIFSIIVGVVAVIMIIYGGFRYVTSGGDNGRVGNAKNTLIYAIIGLFIVALAQLIVRYVLSTASGITVGS